MGPVVIDRGAKPLAELDSSSAIFCAYCLEDLLANAMTGLFYLEVVYCSSFVSLRCGLTTELCGEILVRKTSFSSYFDL